MYSDGGIPSGSLLEETFGILTVPQDDSTEGVR
jgi:hypothetical protein